MRSRNIIVEKTFDFALEIIRYAELLENERKFVLAKQLIRSGISIGANVREAQNAESKADFIHKMKIAAKEIEETEYWLDLCKHSPGYPSPGTLPEKCFEIKKIITTIIGTSKRRMCKRND